MRFPAFERYIGVDYSGAQTPESSLKGLRVYEADRRVWAYEVLPPPSPRKYWSRVELAHWLASRLSENVPTIVGIDHSFSFPLRYFEAYQVPADWQSFLEDFQQHWPTDQKHVYVDFVRNGVLGHGAARSGNARWRRIAEQRSKAKSVFHFDVPGSVAKSTHAGLAWLLYLRKQLGDRLHFWPFDGWDIPVGKSSIVEIYPSLWSKHYVNEGRTPDQHDAFVACTWLKEVDEDGRLENFLSPEISSQERSIAQIEGWILGVG